MKARRKIVYQTEPPDGLFYIPKFIDVEEEQRLLTHVATHSFEPYDHHGYKANREVVYFGIADAYNDLSADVQVEPFPIWLAPLKERFAGLLKLDPDEVAMALLAKYDVGAGIGWHRDRPQFGPTVFGLSLAADAEMRFRHFIGEREEMYKINLERRSAYIISGESRAVWQHAMNPVQELRFSITMRTLKNNPPGSVDKRHSPSQILKNLKDLQLYNATENDPEETKQLKLFAEK